MAVRHLDFVRSLRPGAGTRVWTARRAAGGAVLLFLTLIGAYGFDPNVADRSPNRFALLIGLVGVFVCALPFCFYNRAVVRTLALAVAVLAVGETAVRLVARDAGYGFSRQGANGRGLVSPAETLGYRLNANNSVRERRWDRGKSLYDVTYHIGPDGRRIVPGDCLRDPSTFLVLLGGAAAFGQGVADNETLPYRLQCRLFGTRAYNFGVPGYGPAQFYDMLRKADLGAEIPEKLGSVYFLFDTDHFTRVAGTCRVRKPWRNGWILYEAGPGGPVPRRRLGRLGLIVPEGYAEQAGAFFCFVSSYSRLLNLFLSAVPRTESRATIRTTAALIDGMFAQFRRQKSILDFGVIFYPGSENAFLARALRDRGIRRFEFGDPFAEPFWRTPAGTLPTPAANRALAARIADRLTPITGK